MRNRIAAYLDPPVPTLPPEKLLAEVLWSGATKALVVGDLYLQTDPSGHDAAIAIGADLAALAREVEQRAPVAVTDQAELAATVGQAIQRAEAVLCKLAPLG